MLDHPTVYEYLAAARRHELEAAAARARLVHEACAARKRTAASVARPRHGRIAAWWPWRRAGTAPTAASGLE